MFPLRGPAILLTKGLQKLANFTHIQNIDNYDQLNLLYSQLLFNATRGNGSETPLYFDFHGEPDGDETGYFESYAEGTAEGLAGSLNAPFDGKHGWYWENNTDEPVTVSLLTFGTYSVIGKL